MGERLGYRPGLDGLRGIAVALVVLFHAEVPAFRGGGFGVDIFFVLSGFLITALLAEEWQHTGRVNLRAFYRRRAVRLGPALFIMLLLVTLFALALGVANTAHWVGVVSALAYVQNYARMYFEYGFGLVGHLWTLSIEEQFYIVWPVLFLVVRRRVSLVWLSGLALAAALVIMAVRAQVYDDSWIAPERRTDLRADSLLIGCAIGAGFVAQAKWLRHRAWKMALLPAVLVLAAMVTVGPPDRRFMFVGGFTVLAAAVAVVIVAVVVHEQRWLLTILSWGPLVHVGRRSYAVYLWQTPIILAAQWAGLSWPWVAVVGFVGSLVAAEQSWRLVERPAMRFKHRRPVAVGSYRRG